MADSPDLWTAIGAVIDAVGEVPLASRDGLMVPVLDPAWPRWYRGEVKPRQIDGQDVLPPPGYFLFKQEFESEDGCYNGEGGQDYLGRIGCWGMTPDEARQLYRWLKQQLEGVPLTIPGYDPVTGTLSKNGPTPDTDGVAWQMEASYAAEAMEAA